jgi:indolepyruvate ferredoxin oxidoreductase
MPRAAVSLDDKYKLESGRIFITGTQALVRLPMMQRHRDEAAGLNTACFISGYRGSPLGAYDQQLWRARKFLKDNHIHFQPGVNEDLAATMIWGTQQSAIFDDINYDGVFSIWYGKGPGVDRSGDVFRHGSLSGSAPNGGVLLLAGDDHAAKSSTTAHQCEYAFMDSMIPVLHPAGVQEILDFGLLGWAMSRYSGCWVGFKIIAETADSTASVYIDPHRIEVQKPQDFEMPEGGLNIRWAGALDMVQQEERHHYYKLYAALAFARANKIDKTVIDSPKRRFGIVTTGKSYLDVRQALDDLGIDEAMAAEIGLSVYKVGMVWPLEREGVRHFAEGLEEILVVEEKRAVIENQLKEQLYNWRDDVRPRVVGKFDEAGTRLMNSNGELSPARIAQVIAGRIKRFYTNPRMEQRLALLEQEEKALMRTKAPVTRIPTFCSGCPHNTSTRVPEGSRALAGIGCHYMVQWMDRETMTFTQMGGEGCTWLGQAPFSRTKHVFANLGDGTYYHSGLLAIRQAVATGANITYKILYNDAVAMTGGQPVDGPLTPDMIARQVAAEGVKQVKVVSDEPDKYAIGTAWPEGTTVHHRDDLDQVQRDLREIEGCTVLIYDQTCAAEKRRRRKRGLFPDPPKRVFINDLVCEGCGDCSVKSNCVSVVPEKTEFGTKRKIDQSSCNKDYSCLKGFCPSFVTVHDGEIRKEKLEKAADGVSAWEALPEPEIPGLDDPFNIVITGVGGTGVVTIGALLGMAAHIEGKGCTALDQAGLAQKGGAVVSHIRIAEKPEDIHAVRVSAGRADLVLGCDLVVTAGQDTLSKMEPDLTKVVVNSQETITQEFTRDPNYRFPAEELMKVIGDVASAPEFVDASRIATSLLGDSIAANLFMLGYAYQKGFVPVSAAAIKEAVEINGVAVDFNTQAFLWGRRAAHDLSAVEKLVSPPDEPVERAPETLDQIIERRAAFLTDYQDARYAKRYEDLVARVRAAETAVDPNSERLGEAVARYAFKLMAYKDEYEVARLYTAGGFEKKLRKQFTGDFKLTFHLAPPLFAARDPNTGELKKKEYGPWVFQAFKLLAKLKGLRGTKLDVFGYTAERRHERQLIEDYVALIEELAANLNRDNLLIAVDLASLPDEIRGFGHIKERNIAKTKTKEEELLAKFRDPGPSAPAAEAAE